MAPARNFVPPPSNGNSGDSKDARALEAFNATLKESDSTIMLALSNRMDETSFHRFGIRGKRDTMFGR